MFFNFILLIGRSFQFYRIPKGQSSFFESIWGTENYGRFSRGWNFKAFIFLILIRVRVSIRMETQGGPFGELIVLILRNEGDLELILEVIH